ncbi:MAG TPA: HupE / UreJ protein [Cytophagales bacterium]|nr:HupE / UreJ protein [Cytophagales bacterium]HAA21514.1 HupE / UreJ protein [Cytophagales bacterium]HAP64647.1 HupE / UreJ protein [Cytophagales bacterium]
MLAASNFSIYFRLGMEHILDLDAYDHLCFVIALSALYVISDWKRVLVLVTAFTIGHSITLALATFEVISVDMSLVEFLIPVTILITAVSNLFKKSTSISTRKIQTNYLFALFFGLIHGLGFSNYIRSALMDNSLFVESFLAFNLGLELGQIIIVAITLAVASIMVGLFGVNRREWNLIISSAIGGIALMLIKDVWIF